MPAQSHIWKRKGSIILLSVMLLTVLLPMVGLGIDVTMLYLMKAKLSSAVDGGAIAAARSLSAGLTFEEQRDSAIKTAEQFVQANFPDGFWGASAPRLSDGSLQVEVTQDMASYRRTLVSIQARVQVPLLFMRILGHDYSTVAASGAAARRDVRLVLVLDRSASMSGYMSELRANAKEFVRKFKHGDQLGLVVFGRTALVAYPPRDPNNPDAGTGPDENFKEPMLSLIDKIQSGSNTGMAEALWLAYKELQKNPLKSALNMIVLFTDGLPDGISAEFNTPGNTYIRGSSPCVYKQWTGESTKIIGAIAQGSGFARTGNTVGIFALANRTRKGGSDIETWMSNPDEPVVPDPASRNCSFVGNQNNMKNDVSRIPPTDLYGNSTEPSIDPMTGDWAYKTSDIYKHPDRCNGAAYDPTKVDSPCQIGLASWNVVDDAIKRIRADGKANDLMPVIYVIGFDNGSGEKPDKGLMERMANVGQQYDPDYPAGKYIESGPGGIGAAFAEVMSEVLRLIS